MSPTQLYFSANGRIGPRTFWRAIIILVAIQVVVQLVFSLLPVSDGPAASIISWVYQLLLLISYLNVYAKRLHDGGRGAIWFVLCFLGFLVLSTIVVFGAVLTFAPDLVSAFEDLLEAIGAGASGQVEANILNARLLENTFLLFAANIAALFITNFVIGWLVARLPSDPGVNRFGPPEQGGDPDVFN